MSEDELRAFLEEQMVMTVGTLGPSGRPHLMPLWFVPHGLELSGWTYAKSQKAKNLERDPRATVQVEHGVQYAELRGVMMECDVELDQDVEALVEKQASKRVGLRFTPTRIVSWDHSKLAGVY